MPFLAFLQDFWEMFSDKTPKKTLRLIVRTPRSISLLVSNRNPHKKLQNSSSSAHMHTLHCTSNVQALACPSPDTSVWASGHTDCIYEQSLQSCLLL